MIWFIIVASGLLGQITGACLGCRWPVVERDEVALLGPALAYVFRVVRALVVDDCRAHVVKVSGVTGRETHREFQEVFYRTLRRLRDRVDW